MVSKIQILLIALQLTCIFAYYEYDNETGQFVTGWDLNKRKIYKEMYQRMSIFTKGLWYATPSDQNVQFFPILDLCNMMAELVYQVRLKGINVDTRLSDLEISDLDGLLRSELYNLQSLNEAAKLIICETAFYDKQCSLHPYFRKKFLPDFITFYPTSIFRDFFSLNDTVPITSENFKNLTGANFVEIERLEEDNDYKFTVLFYFSWWGHLMSKRNNFIFHLDEQHNNSTSELKIPTRKFKHKRKLYVDAISTNQILGYFNNTRLGYEATRIHYKNNEFAMAIVLPHQNQTLKMLVNFTAQDYEQLFKRLNESFQPIEFVMPTLNISWVQMNENMTNINIIEKLEHYYTRCPYETCRALKKRFGLQKFIVDRPYGIFIYHINLKFVLWQGLIRDPTSKDNVFRRRILWEKYPW